MVSESAQMQTREREFVWLDRGFRVKMVRTYKSDIREQVGEYPDTG